MYKLQILLCFFLLSHNSAQAKFRDPTRPLNISTPEQSSSQQKQGPMLSAIWHTDTSKHATINGKTLNQGETFNNLTLLKVRENSVLIKHHDLIKTLYLIPTSYKSNH